MDAVHNAIEMGPSGIETLAVAVIVVAPAHGTLAYVFHMRKRVPDGYPRHKLRLGKAPQPGLELFVAADIIRPVALAPTMPNVLIFAVLVVVRTFLSWSLVVEMEGHWAWKS